jgi:periplasmic divalent cation tolerance protein
MDRIPIAVVTTIDSESAAQQMARALVQQGLAACVQITRIESVYMWKNELQQSPEWRLVFKTVRERYPEVERHIRQLHSYEVPAIHAIAFDKVSSAYGDWIAENSSGFTPLAA